MDFKTPNVIKNGEIFIRNKWYNKGAWYQASFLTKIHALESKLIVAKPKAASEAWIVFIDQKKGVK